MRANLGNEGPREAEPVWDEQKGKGQSLPSPQDCHQGLLIVYLSAAFSQRQQGGRSLKSLGTESPGITEILRSHSTSDSP